MLLLSVVACEIVKNKYVTDKGQRAGSGRLVGIMDIFVSLVVNRWWFQSV